MDNLISNIVAKLISCGESSIHLTDCTGITLASNTIKYLQKHNPMILNDVSSDGNILNGEVNFKYLKPKNLPSIAFHWKKKCGFEHHTGTYPRFEISGTNLTISIHSVAHRRFLKPLNRLFPPTSEVDNRHMTLHLADFIWHYVTGKNPCAGGSTGGVRHGDGQKARLRRINDCLQYIPIGTN
jgi:hypothetical protein